MARYEVKNPLTPEGRNQLNAMFEELYKEYIGAGNNAKDAREKAVQAVADSILAKDIAETTRQEMLAIIREQTKNGDLAPEIAQARGGKQTLGERFNSVDSQLAQTDKQLRYHNRQAELLAKFYNKLSKRQPTTIVAQGDSLTYGHDITSDDIRPPDTTPIDDGSTHTTTRASVTYPEKLQSNLREIYGVNHVVINKGRSGDYASLSYERWTNNENSDVALLMLGTNDASNNSYIPGDIQRNVEIYTKDMRRIIQRFFDWDTPVILLTPPRRKEQEYYGMTENYIEPFRQAVYFLGLEYGCPVIDMEEFCNGLDNSYYSDSFHFNGKGYAYLASRLTAKFVGFANTPSIHHGSVIGNRPSRDNMVVNNVAFSVNTASAAAEEGGVRGESVLATITEGDIYLSFYAESDNLVLIPIQGFASGASGKYTLDFGSEQGSVPLLPAINKAYNERVYPPSVIESTKPTNQYRSFNGEVNPETVNDYIHITNKGYHTIKIENGSNVGSLYFQGFVVKSFSDFSSITRIVNDFVLNLQAPTLGSPIYETRISKIIKSGNLVNHFVKIKGTMGSDMSGSISIPLKEKLENVSGFSVVVPIHVVGMFADSTVVTGIILANSSTLYLQKTINGETTNLRGEDIAGKSVELTFTAIYPTSA